MCAACMCVRVCARACVYVCVCVFVCYIIIDIIPMLRGIPWLSRKGNVFKGDVLPCYLPITKA